MKSTSPPAEDAAEAYILSLAHGQVESYRGQPGDVIGDYSHERSVADAYRGRQVLELLQNADDAGAAASGARRVLFRLTEDYLVVANTGEQFSKRGIRALVVSNASPKRLSRARFIGNKGLGFRSVLTWSPAPLVLSGGYLVAFSPEHARREILALAEDKEELREDLEDWVQKFGYVPAPTMRFPYIPDAGDERAKIAGRVRAEGFDTVIVLPLPGEARGEAVRNEITAQLAALGGETVLFCRNLTEVCVQADGGRTWLLERRVDGDHQVVAIDDGSVPGVWAVHRREDVLPSDLLDEELQETPEFEVAVAVPSHPAAKRTHRLCVYFPTDVALPTALLVHATLATDPSRKHVTEHPANKHILARLAELLAEIAERETRSYPPGHGLELLAGAEECDRELRELGFFTTLIAACRRRRILPRLDGQLATAAEVFTAPHRVWLEVATAETLPELLDPGISAEARGFAGQMNLPTFTSAVLAERLERRVRGAEPAEAGFVVGRLVAVRALPRPVNVPAVLVGADCGIVPVQHTVFLPAERGDVQLPGWVERFEFLHPAFAEALRGALGVATVRDARARLVESGYKVEEFRLEGVARHLLSEMNRKRRGVDKSEEVRLCRELLACLFAMARQEDTGDLRRVGLEVVTTRGRVRRADTCYLGPDYSAGALVHALYGPLGQDEFAAAPAEQGIAAEAAAVEGFLTRLGVQSRPRRYTFTNPYQNAGAKTFLRAVLEPLPYPNRIFETDVAEWQEADRLLTVTFEGLAIPDRWEQVLARGTPEAIVAYLIGEGHRHLDSGPVPGGRLTATKGQERKPRPYNAVPVADPAHHFLRAVAWVRCEDSERRTPDRIILSRSGRRVLAGAYIGHGLDLAHPLLRGSGGAPVVEGVLHALGAVYSLDALKPEELYRLLLELPIRDPDGADAGRIYRALAENQDLDTSSSLRERFLQEGRMWGTKNGVAAYYPITRLRYAPRSSVPAPLRDRIPLVSIDPRRGSRSIQRVFGVKPLGPEDFTIALNEAGTRERSWSDEAARRLRRSIAFLYAYRLSRTADETGRERNLLGACRLRVCEYVSVDVTVLGEPESVILSQEHEGLVIRPEGLILLVGPDAYPEFDPVFWRAVGDLVADAVEVAGAASDFAQLLGCQADEQRHRLLDLMTDGEAERLLADAIGRLELEEKPEEEVAEPDPAPEAEAVTGVVPLPLPHAAPPEGAAVTEAGRPPTMATPAQPAVAAPVPVPVPTPVPAPMSAPASAPTSSDPPAQTQRQPVFVPTSAPERRASSRRRYFVTRSASYSGSSPRLDEATSLEIASEFERLNGRFPFAVEHVRGYESLGCDIVSFASEADAREAEQERVVDPARVARFIEVKGRSDRTGEVELEDNQRRAAATYRERFYLYRVYRGPASGQVQLAVLQSPAGSKAEVVRTRYGYDLRAGSDAEWFGLREVLE